MLGNMVDEFGYVFEGTIITRWIALIIVMFGLSVIMLIFQKRKDVI